MIVHFIASATDLNENIDNYRMIVRIIEQLGHTLSRDWIEDALKNYKKDQREALNWSDIVEKNNEALSLADVVIAEAGKKSFSMGFQVAQAIQQKKPVLILTDRTKGEDNIRGTFASGLDSSFVVNKSYDKESLKDTLSDFLFSNDMGDKELRFNFFINKKIYNYLRWAAYKTSRSKSEILRELIEKEIDKQ